MAEFKCLQLDKPIPENAFEYKKGTCIWIIQMIWKGIVIELSHDGEEKWCTWFSPLLQMKDYHWVNKFIYLMFQCTKLPLSLLSDDDKVQVFVASWESR